MKRAWLHHTILHAASLLAPGDQRSEWLEGWRSELWYVPPNRATGFCLGAFRDALWLRRNNVSAERHARTRLESPLRCLAFLAALAAMSIFFALRMPDLQPKSYTPGLSGRYAPVGCVAMVLFTCLLLPATRFGIGRAPGNRRPMSWSNRLRRGLFLALKIALVQPIMLGEFLVLLVIGPVVPFAPVALFVGWILTFRWLLIDQRRRCPVCLRLLTHPVRIGAPSRTFLEWYGAESMCSRGHGLLHVPEISASQFGQEWLSLDGSWSGLFWEAAGRRQ